MTSYRIRRLHFFPAFKFGCLIGTVVTVLPAFLLALVVYNILGTVRSWLESWAILELPGLLPDLNLLQIINLADVLTQIQRLHNMGWLLVGGLTIGLIIGGGLFSAVMAGLSTLVYNLVAAISGGLVYSADVEGQVGQVAQVAQAAPAPGRAAANPWFSAPQDPQQRWPLPPGRITVGSAASNSLPLPKLAPQHAEIRRETQGYVLYDLSGGQTWVNNQPVLRPTLLPEGTTVQFGTYAFHFHPGSP